MGPPHFVRPPSPRFAPTDKERPKTLSVRFALSVDTTANAFPDQARSNGLRKAGFVAARHWIRPSVI